MGTRPNGVKKAKRLDEDKKREKEVADNLRKMRKAVEESNRISKKIFDEIIDLHGLSQMEDREKGPAISF